MENSFFQYFSIFFLNFPFPWQSSWNRILYERFFYEIYLNQTHAIFYELLIMGHFNLVPSCTLEDYSSCGIIDEELSDCFGYKRIDNWKQRLSVWHVIKVCDIIPVNFSHVAYLQKWFSSAWLSCVLSERKKSEGGRRVFEQIGVICTIM